MDRLGRLVRVAVGMPLLVVLGPHPDAASVDFATESEYFRGAIGPIRDGMQRPCRTPGERPAHAADIDDSTNDGADHPKLRVRRVPGQLCFKLVDLIWDVDHEVFLTALSRARRSRRAMRLHAGHDPTGVEHGRRLGSSEVDDPDPDTGSEDGANQPG